MKVPLAEVSCDREPASVDFLLASVREVQLLRGRRPAFKVIESGPELGERGYTLVGVRDWG